MKPVLGRLFRIIVNDEKMNDNEQFQVKIRDFVVLNSETRVTCRESELVRDKETHAWELGPDSGPRLVNGMDSYKIRQGKRYRPNYPYPGDEYPMNALLDQRINTQALIIVLNGLNEVTREAGKRLDQSD